MGLLSLLFSALAGPQEPSDEALMERFLAGDARALGLLYDRHARPLLAFAAQQGARRPDDVVQDAFLRVVKNGQGFKGQAKFRTWLYTIARNLCIDASRRDRFRSGPSLDAPTGDGDGPTLGDRLASDMVGGDALRNTADGQFRHAYEAAMALLPEEQREVFAMREMGGLSFAEIAEATQCNENTVKSRMRYALKALRDALIDFC